MNRDRGVGIFSIALGAWVAYMTAFRIGSSNMAGDIGPKVFPYISAGILIVCGVILLVRRPKEQKPWLVGEQWKRFLGIIAVILGYVGLLYGFGFIVASVIFVTVLFLMFGKEDGAKIWKAVLYAAIVTLIIYLIFAKGLHLRMPEGRIFTLKF